jgi:transposase-like protein
MALRRQRDLKKEEFWRRMLRRQAGSGLSFRAWCLKHNLQQSALYWWRRELARRDADPPATAFVPVRLTEDSPAKSDPVIEVLLANERRILLRGSVNRSMLAEVLAVLEGPGC